MSGDSDVWRCVAANQENPQARNASCGEYSCVIGISVLDRLSLQLQPSQTSWLVFPASVGVQGVPGECFAG